MTLYDDARDEPIPTITILGAALVGSMVVAAGLAVIVWRWLR